MSHREIIRGDVETIAGRMHAQEIVEGADRLRVVMLFVISKTDVELGLFGVRAEGILVDQLLVIFDRGPRNSAASIPG